MKRFAPVVLLACVLGIALCYAQSAKQEVSPGLFGIDYPCNGMVKRLPADLLGREFRGQCIEGIEVWTWADTVPAAFWKAQNAVFVVVINRRNETASVALDGFWIVSMDRKHPKDPDHSKAIQAINPEQIVQKMAWLAMPSHSAPPPRELFSSIYNSRGQYVGQIVSTDPLWPLVVAIREQQENEANEQNAQTISTITGWITRTSYTGGAISAGGELSGLVYFGKIKGVTPMLMYVPNASLDKSKYIGIPLGNWPIEQGLAPQ